MMFKRFLAAALLAGLAGGCTAGNFNSIYRQFDVNANQSQLVDVKQRSILISNNKTVTTNTLTDRRGTVTTLTTTTTAPRICAEPSPDAMSVYATTLAAQGSDGAGVSASLNASSTESGTAFGLRTQSIQLMRDAYYRACEAFMSRAIDDETYDVLIRRLNNQAIAYLAIEQITSNASRTPAAITPPDLTAQVAAVTKAQAEFAVIDATVADDQKKLDAATADADKTAAKAKLEKDRTEQGQKREILAKAVTSLQEAGKPAVNANGASPGAPSASAAAVEAASQIALAVITADYSPQMCFAHLRRYDPPKTGTPLNSTDPKIDANVYNFCANVLTNQRQLQAANVSAIVANNAKVTNMAEAIKVNCAPATPDDKTRAACAKVLDTFASMQAAEKEQQKQGAGGPTAAAPGRSTIQGGTPGMSQPM